ncbi:protein CREG1 isoform X2 [Phyllobates terribilis]|uniref:protein CREG1 isoform X1 n=2 Tax=Phyllobates terribilis TaxID=111132 RepID=UPI003CCADC08
MSWTGVIVFWGVSVVFFLVLSLGAAAIPPRNETARVARYVAHKCDWGALATLSSHEPVRGLPFANVFSVSDGPRGQSGGVLYFYLTTMEISVQDLQVNANTSLTMSLAQTPYCRQEHYDPQSPLCAHVIMSGSIQEVAAAESDKAKTALFSRHPEMATWPHDHNWFFAKLNITNIWVLDYFGGIKTVTPEEYYQAKP